MPSAEKFLVDLTAWVCLCPYASQQHAEHQEKYLPLFAMDNASTCTAFVLQGKWLPQDLREKSVEITGMSCHAFDNPNFVHWRHHIMLNCTHKMFTASEQCSVLYVPCSVTPFQSAYEAL